MLRILTFYSIAWLFLIGLHSAIPAFAGAPYSNSTFITHINFNISSVKTYAPGSDIWPSTWANDDNIYTAWGDGNGFTGAAKVSYGFGKVGGTITLPTVADVFYGPSGSGKGKIRSLLAIGGSTLYAWNGLQNASNDCVLMTSANNGASWSTNSWFFRETVEFAPCSFLQFGKNYAGARDGYVYAYGLTSSNTHTVVYLARVLIANVGDRTQYQYCTSINANNQPGWGGMAGRIPVFEDHAGAPSGVEVVHNTGIGRYLLTTSFGDAGQIAVYEGLEPWGPWKTVMYQTNWAGLSGEEMTGFNFPSKWISADGKSLGLFFAPWGSNNANWNDHLCTMSVTLNLAPSLSVQLLATNIVLTWPVQPDSYAVESTTSLLGTFTVLPATLTTNLGQQTVSATLPASGAGTFFRLKKL